jgi:hypothetical protein
LTRPKTALRNWLFKGLSIDRTLGGLERDGLAVRAGSNPDSVQQAIPLEDFSLPVRQNAMKAMPAYLAFFCLENAVRELVAERLTEKFGTDWWEQCASAAMKSQVTERKAKEGKNRWHIERGAHEVNYTNFGDLRNIIVSKWAEFEDLFPDQSWITSRLDELEASRNIIAHSNVLDDREMNRLGLYLQDWKRQTG